MKITIFNNILFNYKKNDTNLENNNDDLDVETMLKGYFNFIKPSEYNYYEEEFRFIKKRE